MKRRRRRRRRSSLGNLLCSRQQIVGRRKAEAEKTKPFEN
jgi:hypothetical protein